MILPLIIVGLQLATTVQNDVPNLDINRSCRAEAVGSLGFKFELDTCLKSEEDARSQLSKGWNEFAAADRGTCVGLSTMGGQSTYIELLTCLEMLRDARKLPKDADTTVGRTTR
jgi:hypothetical protein